MLIATDGACKRNGKPDCTSTGVAWIETEDGNMLFKAQFEPNSTSQRGEINGLIQALQYARDNVAKDEYVIIVTDSEYLHNTVMKEWCFKWQQNNWITGSGEEAKNRDQWDRVCCLLKQIGRDRVYLQWTKGHLLAYTPANTRAAMKIDVTGIELYSRIETVARRPSEYGRATTEFNLERVKHNYTAIPKELAIQWITANVIADCLATYVESLFDDAYLVKQDSIN